MKFSLLDGRGRESKTLFFVVVSWAALLFKFVLAGLSIKWTFINMQFAPMTATEFGMAFTCVIGVWVGREHLTKKKEGDKHEDVTTG